MSHAVDPGPEGEIDVEDVEYVVVAPGVAAETYHLPAKDSTREDPRPACHSVLVREGREWMAKDPASVEGWREPCGAGCYSAREPSNGDGGALVERLMAMDVDDVDLDPATGGRPW